MPVTIQLDEITKSQFEADVHGIRYLQYGKALSINETDPSKILARIPTLSGVDPLGNAVRVPGVGTPHKIYGQAMVTGYRVTGIGHFDAEFAVVYESPSGLGLGFLIDQWYPFWSSSVQQEETWLDARNDPIIIHYAMPGSSAGRDYPGKARRFFATADLTLTGVFLDGATDAQTGAVGRINKGPSNWFRKKPFTMLCTSFVSRPEIFGVSWRKTATFAYNERTWDAFERFTDPNNGQPPKDISGSDVAELFSLTNPDFQERRNGVTRIRVNDMQDFSIPFGVE